jgi:hypothetical protein
MKITRREAIDAIKGMFETNTREADNASVLTEYENDTAIFMFDKRKYERYEIIDKLSEFFDGVSIIDGQCRISSVTFVFTNVYIEERP